MANKFSLIKSNENIRKAIIARVAELKLSQQKIILDAAQRGRKLPMDMLSRYLHHGDTRGSLREDQIIWLATRYGVYIHLKVGKPIIDKETGKTSYEITPYNEEEALKVLNTIYPTK